MPSLVIDDFSGGLNLRDSPNQLKPNETPGCNDFMLTERGGIKRRNGCENAVALPGVTGTVADIFYSAALDLWFCARETAGAPNTLKLHTRPGDLSGSWTDRGTINSVVTARAAFIDFPGNPPLVVITTDVNSGATKGVFTYNAVGPALTSVAANIAGNAIALWQDRAIVAGYPTSDANGNPTRFFASGPKDVTTSNWSNGWNNDVREKDAAPLTGLGVVGGALVVFKKRSAYRVNDSATGAYTTIDTAAGCVNPRAVAALRGRLYVWGPDGMYECDGVGPLRNVGDKLQPLYLALSASNQAAICAGIFEDTVIFAPMAALTLAGDVMQLYPRFGACVAHILGSSTQNQVTSFARKDATLYAAIADGDDLFSMFTGTGAAAGKDDATAFGGTWFTPWLLPNSGMLSRLHRARVQGLGGSSATVALLVGKDWNPNGPASYDISASLTLVGSEVQRAADVMSIGHAYSFQMAFTVTGTGFNTGLSIRALQLIDQSLAWPSPGYPAIQRGVRSGNKPSTPPPRNPPPNQ